MVKYIIKISCTSERELAYNNRIIRQNNIPKDTLEDLIYEFNCEIGIDIDSIIIIYKTLRDSNGRGRGFTHKKLEFEYDSKNELNDIEFITFIRILKRYKFLPYPINDNKTNTNTNTIRYVNKTNEHTNILNYKYISEEKIDPPNIPYDIKPNKSDYSTRILYKNLLI